MPRYIDSEDAIYELERAFSADDYGKIIRCISRTPTADVVEVVRCKYCKHYDFSDVNITPYGAWYKCKATGMYTPQIHYCGFGDKREDG